MKKSLVTPAVGCYSEYNTELVCLCLSVTTTNTRFLVLSFVAASCEDREPSPTNRAHQWDGDSLMNVETNFLCGL
jgi:hypothetical protein